MPQHSTQTPRLTAFHTFSLASFYFFFCAVLGAIFSYWGVYLDAIHYTPGQIAKMGGVFLAANIIATNLWGAASQIRNDPTWVVRTGLFCALLMFIAQMFAATFNAPSNLWFYLHLVTYGLFSGCFMGIAAQSEVVVINRAHGGLSGYGAIRVWGSIGFVFSVNASGLFIDNTSPSELPLLILGFVALTFLSSLGFPSTRGPNTQGTPKRYIFCWNIFRRPSVWLFLLATALLNFSLGSYYTFFSLFAKYMGHSETNISLFWSVSIIGEIVLFFILKRFISEQRLAALFALSLVFTAIRWLVIGLIPENTTAVLAAQTLHAFSFALAHATCIGIVALIFTKEYQSQGISFYIAFLVNGAAALGALAGSFFEISQMKHMFLMNAFANIVAVFLMLMYLLLAKKSSALIKS